MSVSATASLRPLGGRCLSPATTGPLSVQLRSQAATAGVEALVTLHPPRLARCQSTAAGGGKDGPPKPEQPKMTFRRFVGGALGASLRNLAVAVSPRGIRAAYRDSPAATSISIVL